LTTRAQKEEMPQEEMYAIRNVNIIPMTRENKIITNVTVIIGGKKILSINEPIPAKAKLIDGKGKWLIQVLLICTFMGWQI
jgi:imidazolonepropionase-like amidohydrolase